MKVGKSGFVAAAWAALALIGSQGAQANLVSNGGFETGDFSGWTTSNLASYDSVYDGAPKDGTYAASMGNTSGVSVLSQSLATVAGTTYNISFWLQNEADVNGLATPNSFEFDWGAALVNGQSDAPEYGYTNFNYSLVATSASTDLTFRFSQGAAFWDFDSVSVDAAATSVPEPDSLALTGLAGVLGLVVSRRRMARDRRAAAQAA